jgi:rare lipoprotein A
VAVYPAAFAGRLTASGTAYDPEDFVVSHPSLPFNSVVLLSSRDPENHTFARVIDRGPIEDGVLLDVSDAVAQQLGLGADDHPSVALRVVWVANSNN